MKGYLSRLIARAAPVPPVPVSNPTSFPVADPLENVEFQRPMATPPTQFESRELQPPTPAASTPPPTSKSEQPEATPEPARFAIEPRPRTEREIVRHEITVERHQAAPQPNKIEPTQHSERIRETQPPAPPARTEPAPNTVRFEPARELEVPDHPLPSVVREAETVIERVISRIEPRAPAPERIVVREEPSEPRVMPATLTPAESRGPSHPLEQTEEAPRLMIGRLIVDVVSTPPAIAPVYSRVTRRAPSRGAFPRTPAVSFGLGQM